ncbi:T9SS type A sorting domain-containing protein [Flavobacterium sp.]|uniref:T9SS-dependent choice-of-anchor J family protein n=1 Tax=Flavobacterium sp. TaxID=239 RepID=UPI002608AB63|nr:T9SS type A sorting domain-containing protein [Flavobacterium sp.]
MKKLLLLTGLVFGSISMYAQTTCATATNISGTGTLVCPAITGTYPAGTGLCYTAPATAPKAIWYKFTPATGGVLSVTSGIAANPVATTDTRLSVFTGACGGPYTCVALNDDINEAGQDYRSAISNITLTAGTTYYIVWDNRWSATGFSFDFTFTAATCFKPTGFTYTAAPTTTSVGLGWTAPAQGFPEGYDFEYGPTGFVQGTGTLVSTADTSVSLTTLSPNSIYDFYIRSNCGFGDFSVWAGPISFSTLFTPATPPYNTSFEETSFDFVGWTLDEPATYAGESWQVYPAGAGSPLVQDGDNMALIFSSNAASGPNDSWLISRGLDLNAGATVTVSYYVRNYVNATSTGTSTYELKAGTSQDIVGMTIPIATESETSATYVQKTSSFVAPSTGTYYLGFHSTNAVNAGTHATFIDNVAVSQVLGTEDYLASQFAVFPNPANDVININNTNDAIITNVKVTDLKGRTVKSSNVVAASNVQISASDLSAGVYFLNITSDKGTVVKKIVKK